MVRTTILVGALLVAAGLAGCGTTATSEPSAAERLAAADGSTDTVAYQQAIDALTPKCSNPPDKVPNIAQGTLKVLNDGGESHLEWSCQLRD